MTVITFAPKLLQQDGLWQASELSTMQGTFTAEFVSGEASGWHTALTEVSDPQFYCSARDLIRSSRFHASHR